MTPVANATDATDLLAASRRRTLDLIENVTTADLERVLSEPMSPRVWDLAHIASYEDLWIGHRYGGLSLLHPNSQRCTSRRPGPALWQTQDRPPPGAADPPGNMKEPLTLAAPDPCIADPSLPGCSDPPTCINDPSLPGCSDPPAWVSLGTIAAGSSMVGKIKVSVKKKAKKGEATLRLRAKWTSGNSTVVKATVKVKPKKS